MWPIWTSDCKYGSGVIFGVSLPFLNPYHIHLVLKCQAKSSYTPLTCWISILHGLTFSLWSFFFFFLHSAPSESTGFTSRYSTNRRSKSAEGPTVLCHSTWGLELPQILVSTGSPWTNLPRIRRDNYTSHQSSAHFLTQLALYYQDSILLFTFLFFIPSIHSLFDHTQRHLHSLMHAFIHLAFGF